MSAATICDICQEPIVRRTADWFEVIDANGGEGDVCSAECLATLAVGFAHQRGESHAQAVADAARPTHRAWWRAFLIGGAR